VDLLSYLALLAVIFSWVLMLCELPTGILADRYGYKRSLFTGNILRAIGCLLYAAHWGVARAVCAANGSGIVGIALSSTILPIRVTDAVGITERNARLGIKKAIDEGSKVLNCSFGHPNKSTGELSAEYQDAIDYAKSKNVVIVAASGNNVT
jgi:subtilisin family serine protease